MIHVVTRQSYIHLYPLTPHSTDIQSDFNNLFEKIKPWFGFGKCNDLDLMKHLSLNLHAQIQNFFRGGCMCVMGSPRTFFSNYILCKFLKIEIYRGPDPPPHSRSAHYFLYHSCKVNLTTRKCYINHSESYICTKDPQCPLFLMLLHYTI